MGYEVKDSEKLCSELLLATWIRPTQARFTKSLGIAYEEGEENVSHDARTAGSHDARCRADGLLTVKMSW